MAQHRTVLDGADGEADVLTGVLLRVGDGAPEIFCIKQEDKITVPPTLPLRKDCWMLLIFPRLLFDSANSRLQSSPSLSVSAIHSKITQ